MDDEEGLCSTPANTAGAAFGKRIISRRRGGTPLRPKVLERAALDLNFHSAPQHKSRIMKIDPAF